MKTWLKTRLFQNLVLSNDTWEFFCLFLDLIPNICAVFLRMVDTEHFKFALNCTNMRLMVKIACWIAGTTRPLFWLSFWLMFLTEQKRIAFHWTYNSTRFGWIKLPYTLIQVFFWCTRIVVGYTYEILNSEMNVCVNI